MGNAPQRSFAKGEIAPAAYARTDQVAYATGLKTCRNFRVLRQGGIENRPGTTLVGAVFGNSAARLLPFVFNDSQTYVLEFTNLRLRFIRSGGYVGAPYILTTPYTAADLPGLQIVQSADVVTIVHPSHPPAALERLADTSWTLTAISFAPQTPTPANVTLEPASSPGGTFQQWVVTAIDGTSGQESLASDPVGTHAIEAIQQRTIVWDAVDNATAYNIYKGYTAPGATSTDFGFIGSTGTLSFYDSGFTPDFLNRAPVARDPFVGAGNYPSTVAYYQGRQVFANTLNAPETVWTSRSADYTNFTTSSPSQDDDAITFSLAGKKVSSIKHLLAGTSLLAFSDGGEWVVSGDQADVLRPTDVTARNFSKHGCSNLAPIEVGEQRVLYVQGRQSIVRDIQRDPLRGYQGADLTVMSVHLFDGYTLADWAYQEIPHSIVWIVRSDGVLLGLTDVAEQQVLAWHRHDTLGSFENVCTVPEGDEDAVYVVVNRGGTRYVERFASRFITPANIADAIFMDSALTYDGRNTNATKTMRMTGGSDWTYDESLTLTCSGSQFVVSDVGNQYFLTGSDGTVIRFSVAGYTSATVVTGFPQRTVPASMQGVTTATWARAVNQVSGLDHLDGSAVAVFADSYVVASPNNPQLDRVVVSGGVATLGECYAYIHAGLPYVSDLETLDIDSAEGPSLKEKKLLINRLSMIVANSRGIFAGPNAPTTDRSTDGLVEFKARDQESYSEPVTLRTGTIKMNIPTNWDTSGHVFVRQVDPIPLSVLGIIPTGNIPPASP